MELKRILDEYDKVFQQSKQKIRNEIDEFCSSQQPFDKPVLMKGDPPLVMKDHPPIVMNDESQVTQNINDNICNKDNNNINGHYCNYDDGYEGFFEPCHYHDNVDSCENDGLTDEGAKDCKERCFNDTTPLKPKLPDCTKSQIKSFIQKTKSDFLTIDQMCGKIKVDNTECKIDMTDVPTCRDALDKCETQRCRDVIQECKPTDNCIYNDYYKLDTVTNKICRREGNINKCNSNDLLKYFKSNLTEPKCPLLPKENISDDKNYKNSYCDLYKNYKESDKCSESIINDKDVICKGRFCFNAKTKKLCRDE